MRSPSNGDLKKEFCVDILNFFRENTNNTLFFLVCGRTFQETKAIFGSPQQAVYSFTPGIEAQPYIMVSSNNMYISVQNTQLPFPADGYKF